MDHQLRAGMAERAVIRIRITGVEGEIVRRCRVHLRRRDRIKALWRLTVALADLRPEVAGPATNRISLQKRKAPGAVLLPDLELRFLLEQADQDRRLQIHVLGFDLGEKLGG